MSYRRRASPLHAARAAAAIAWCAALGVAALTQSNPLVLGAIAVAVVLSGVLAGVGRQLRRSLLWGLPLWLAVGAINALVTRDGLTVIWRIGTVPLLGQANVTLEATVYGAVLGLRAVVLVLIGTLYSVAVDPDDVLRLFRRVSFSSALSATIATRMVPVLMRDSRRMAEAQRCRPGPPPGRAQLLRATTAGVLDRALDVAATLEVRGYGAARQRA
ncbi:MAG: energy-coupling factor transporter transmembrane protein EcfT, partial [Acidobacteriota bacterium]|nr:energy-coupling factor transporter transmembrane protein EcfT [Acidobacteriota bacterium]